MKLSDLSPAVIDRIKARLYDRIVEKHEGPEKWDSAFRVYEPEFMLIDGCQVLLPVFGNHHSNIEILRCIVSNDGQSLTIFLKDMTYNFDPGHEAFYVGRIAVCDKFEAEVFFLAILYHEWFVINSK